MLGMLLTYTTALAITMGVRCALLLTAVRDRIAVRRNPDYERELPIVRGRVITLCRDLAEDLDERSEHVWERYQLRAYRRLISEMEAAGAVAGE